MTETIEEALARTLSHRAERAPRMPGDLTARVETLRRRKRRRTQVICTVAAVALIGGGTSFAFQGQGESGSTPTLAIPKEAFKTAPTAGSDAQPIEKVWPEAVHRIPNRLTTGAKFQPITLIDEKTLLITTWVSFEKTNALFSYDLTTGGTRKIADVVTPQGSTTFASDFTIGDGRIAWWTSTDSKATIWTAPLPGGETKALTEFPSGPPSDFGPVNGLSLADGKARWAQGEDGVHEMALSGGDATKIPESENHRIVIWPWIGTPRPFVQGSELVYKDIRNVETGEKRTASGVAPGDSRPICGIEWCYGDGKAQRRDGTKTVSLPGQVTFPDLPPAFDRFVTSTGYNGKKITVYLVDLKSGKTAAIQNPGNSSRSMSSAVDRLFYQDTKDGYLLVDLAAIR